MRLLDIRDHGDLLVAVTLSSREMIGRAPDAADEQDLSWLDWSTPRLMSDDGAWIVFEEGNDVNDDGYGVYMRDTRGGAPLLLGYGTAVALSPDARWLAAVERPFGEDPQLALVPTGPGNPVPIETGSVIPLPETGTWLPGEGANGRGTLYFAGRESDGTIRLYRLPLDGTTEPVAITQRPVRTIDSTSSTCASTWSGPPPAWSPWSFASGRDARRKARR